MLKYLTAIGLSLLFTFGIGCHHDSADRPFQKPSQLLQLKPFVRPLLAGSSTLPNRIIFFLSFDCPNSRHAFDRIVPKLMKDFVNPGLAALQFVPLTQSDSECETVKIHSLYCAREQGKMVAFTEQLFGWSNGQEMCGVIPATKAAGLDVLQMQSCMQKKRYLGAIRRNFTVANDYHVSSVPYFYLNSSLLNDSDYDMMHMSILAQLRE